MTVKELKSYARHGMEVAAHIGGDEYVYGVPRQCKHTRNYQGHLMWQVAGQTVSAYACEPPTPGD